MAIRLGTATPTKLYLGSTEVTKAYLGASEAYSSAPSVWTPASLGADLALWLDAEDTASITLNGSTVSQWDDKSGNNFNFANATASEQPAYLATGLNGKPSLRTDGNDTLFYQSSLLGQNVSGLTAAIVGVHPVGAGFVANACDFFISNGVGNLSTRFALLVNPAGQTGDRYSIAGRRLDADTYVGVPSSTSAVTNAGNPWIRIGQRAYSAGVANHWTNGTQDMTNGLVGTQGSGNTSDTASLRSNLFTNNSTTAGFAPANSQLSEIVVTHSTMTTTDRQKLEGYLAHKWGLTYALPSGHPYKWDTSLFGGTNQDGFDADAKTYITAVETADVRDLEPAVREAINDFVVGCKSDGIWTAIKASCILAGARTLAGALVPLKGSAPTNFNFVSGNYNRTTGLVGDGSTKYLDSNRNNNADPQNSKHIAAYLSSYTDLNTTSFAISSSSTGGTTGVSQITLNGNADTIVGRVNSTQNLAISAVYGGSFLAGAARTSSNSVTLRANNTTVTDVKVSQVPNNANMQIYAGFGANYTSARLAFYSIGESLDLALLDARITTLINAYGAI